MIIRKQIAFTMYEPNTFLFCVKHFQVLCHTPKEQSCHPNLFHKSFVTFITCDIQKFHMKQHSQKLNLIHKPTTHVAWELVKKKHLLNITSYITSYCKLFIEQKLGHLFSCILMHVLRTPYPHSEWCIRQCRRKMGRNTIR